MVCAMESRQRLPAFRRKLRNIGVSNIAKHLPRETAKVNRCVACRRGRYDKRYAKPLAIGAAYTPASRTAKWIAAARNAGRIAHKFQCVRGSSRPGRGLLHDRAVLRAGNHV